MENNFNKWLCEWCKEKHPHLDSRPSTLINRFIHFRPTAISWYLAISPPPSLPFLPAWKPPKPSKCAFRNEWDWAMGFTGLRRLTASIFDIEKRQRIGQQKAWETQLFSLGGIGGLQSCLFLCPIQNEQRKWMVYSEYTAWSLSFSLHYGITGPRLLLSPARAMPWAKWPFFLGEVDWCTFEWKKKN